MKNFNNVILTLFVAVFLFCGISKAASARDGVVWDGRAYPFYLLNQKKPNSKSNPFIINTAGKLANITYLLNDNRSARKKKGRNFFINNAKVNKIISNRDEIVKLMKEGMKRQQSKSGLEKLRDAFEMQNRPNLSDDELRAQIKKNFGFWFNKTDAEYQKHLKKAKSYQVGLYLRKDVDRGYYRITRNLNLNGSKHLWRPVVISFSGKVDGGGHVITNMRVTEKSVKRHAKDEYRSFFSLGLFQSSGDISNLTIGKGSSVSFDSSKLGIRFPSAVVHAGGFSGFGSSFRNCCNMATINICTNQDIFAGGIAGEGDNFKNCRNKGKLRVSIAKINKYAKVPWNLAYPMGHHVGGLAGKCSGNILNSSNSGEIYFKGACYVVAQETFNVGGLAGYFESKYILNSFNTGKIRVRCNGSTSGIGGLIGDGRGVKFLRNCYNSGTITFAPYAKRGSYLVGGIIGQNGYVYNSYNSGKIDVNVSDVRTISVGGIGGELVYPENCYNIGKVSSLAKGNTINKVGPVIGIPSSHDIKGLSARNIFWLKSSCADFENYDEYKGLGSVLSFNSKKNLIKSEENDNLEDVEADTLLQALNAWGDLSLDKRDKIMYSKSVTDSQNYNRWIINRKNRGYPVLSKKKFSPTGPVNLAFEKQAKADSFRLKHWNEAIYGNDGDENRGWAAADKEVNHWWRVDLGKSYDLQDSEIVWPRGRVCKYKIEVSKNDRKWTTVVDKSGNTDKKQLQKDSFIAKSVRYVRVKVTGLENGRRASFNEFRVFLKR